MEHHNHTDHQEHSDKGHSCHPQKGRPDYLFWGSLIPVIILYLQFALFQQTTEFMDWYAIMARSVFELVNTVWWGVVVGILMLSILSRIPREFVSSALGTNQGAAGIFRATAAGVMLDLCSHGILMVGAKLYERGASIGQVMAFLIASPWNSFSLTLILFALIGVGWTLAFIALSMLIAIVVGLVFDILVKRKVLPANPNTELASEDFHFWYEARRQLSQVNFSLDLFRKMLVDGIRESRMVIRWLLLGLLLAGLIRAFVTPEMFASWFGPSLAGLGLTVIAATIIEVCSEGSTPIAADLLTRANAPGNSFAFLMTGVATDYTEIMVLKDTTKSWKIALYLPLISVPQVLAVAWLMNTFAV